MSLKDDFTKGFSQLAIALDRVLADANQLLQILNREAGHAVSGPPIQINREAIRDEIMRLHRVADELKIHAMQLRESSTDSGWTVDDTLNQWIRIRGIYENAGELWSNLGETLTSSMAIQLGSQHPRNPGDVRKLWEPHFPFEDDIDTAMALVDANLGDYPDEGPADTTITSHQELSDRYLLQLRYSMGLPQSMIGKLTGVGQAATATRLNRALERLILPVATQRLRATVKRDGLTLGPWKDSSLAVPSALRNIGVQVSQHSVRATKHDTNEFLKNNYLINRVRGGERASELDFSILLITLPPHTDHNNLDNCNIFNSIFFSTIVDWHKSWYDNARRPKYPGKMGVIALYFRELPLKLIDLDDFFDLFNTYIRNEQSGIRQHPKIWHDFFNSDRFKQNLVEIYHSELRRNR